MENLRDHDHAHDHEQRKRKIAAISYNGTHDQTCGFRNAFQTYAASATSLLSSTSSAGFAQDECSLQELKDGHHDPKKLKTTPPPLCKEKVMFSSPSASELSEVITIGSHTLSTPLPSSKYHHSSSLSSSPSPSPVLSSQDSAKSTGSSSAFNGKLCCPATSPLFSAGHENLIEDAGFDEVMDLTSVARRLFERPTTKGVFDSLKNYLEPILMNRLKELAQSEATFEVGQEMADSVYLLKLLSSSNRELDIVGKKAGKGAMLLQEGVKLVREGQELLRSATSDIRNSNDK